MSMSNFEGNMIVFSRSLQNSNMDKKDADTVLQKKQQIIADLNRISKFVSFDIMLSKAVWEYLGGPERLDYDNYCALLTQKISNASTGVLIGNALVSVYMSQIN